MCHVHAPVHSNIVTYVYIVMQLSIPDGESVPECSFVIEWVGSGKPSTTLHHIVTLSGTADKDDFFALRVNPGKTLVFEVAIA